MSKKRKIKWWQYIATRVYIMFYSGASYAGLCGCGCPKVRNNYNGAVWCALCQEVKT